jgi:transcriptional regulator with XRE-family HTH domain
MDARFLRSVQDAGWLISSANQQYVLAECPNAGCGMTALLKRGTVIPQACQGPSRLKEVALDSFQHGRVELRRRREEMALTIKDLEEIAGAAGDHFAKAEKDDPSKVPNAQIFIEWAHSLGYDVVLRPGRPLTPLATRIIADSRDRAAARWHMQGHLRAQRGQD